MAFAQRAGLYTRTILSGDLSGTPTITSDDAYHVVSIGTGVTGAGSDRVILDGFMIQRGNADTAVTGDVSGGGLLAVDSHFRLENVTFKKNLAEVFGGGLYVTSNVEERPEATPDGRKCERRTCPTADERT